MRISFAILIGILVIVGCVQADTEIADTIQNPKEAAGEKPVTAEEINALLSADAGVATQDGESEREKRQFGRRGRFFGGGFGGFHRPYGGFHRPYGGFYRPYGGFYRPYYRPHYHPPPFFYPPPFYGGFHPGFYG